MGLKVSVYLIGSFECRAAESLGCVSGCFEARGSGFRVKTSGKVQGLGFGVWGLGLRA